MAYDNLQIEEADGIVTVTINRPKALNALNQATIAELNTFFSEDHKAHSALKGVILTGAGEKAFVAGADIKEFLGLSEQDGAMLSKTGQDVFFLIERMPVPVIAAIDGFTLGGGCELAMACHMRIASDKSRFGQPEVNLGIIPGYGGTQRLIQLIGKGKAIELILTGDMLDASEAHRLGLVNHVVAPGEEVAKAREIIEKIATKGPIAIAKSIECINAHFEEGLNGFEFEWRAFGETSGTQDFKEGATAFIERRAANFSGK